MIATLIGLSFLQGSLVDSDNATIIACLNGQLAGKPAKCQGLSDEFTRTMTIYDAKPGLRFMLSNIKARHQLSDVWIYPSQERKVEFLKAILNKLVIPFKEWSVTNRIENNPNDPEATFRINNSIGGVLDNFDCIVVGVNFSTGRITSVDLELEGEVRDEVETITDKKVFDKIKEDGPDYDIIYDKVVWSGLSYKTTDMLYRKAVVTPSGKVILVKQRTVEVKRNDTKKVYVFRMDGSLLYSE